MFRGSGRQFTFSSNFNGIKFVSFSECSLQKKSDINLFYSKFNAFDFLPRTFTIISSTKKAYKFNVDMIKSTSHIISHFLDNNPNNLQFFINFGDDKILEKFEQLFLGKIVSFSKNDISGLKSIETYLNLQCFSFVIKSDTKIVIDNNSFLLFLQKKITKSFTIRTNTKNYKCNIIGINSSNVINKMRMNKDTIDFDYKYDDENDKFQIICDFFNFETINITPQNIKILKKIAYDLQILCLTEDINIYINLYEKKVQIIDSQQPFINCFDDLFDCLYNRKNAKVESAKDYLINSIWCQNEENIQELVAYIIHIIHTDVLMHPFLIKLLILLDQNIENNMNLKILIPFLVQKLMSNIGCNKLNCAFIYRLYRNKIIPINKIIDEIIKSITLNEYKTKKEEKEKKSNNIFTLRSKETISENRMFYYDYMIKYDNKFNIENINNMIVWFFPELIRCKACSLDDILNKLDDPNKNFLKLYFPNGIEKFMLMRDNGEPDDELTRVIRNDDVERLSTIISHKKDENISRQIITYNLFESFIKNGETNIIDYASAYGAIKCFKFLFSKNYDKNNYALKCAVFGQNRMIINSLIQNKSLSYEDELNKTSSNPHNLSKSNELNAKLFDQKNESKELNSYSNTNSTNNDIGKLNSIFSFLKPKLNTNESSSKTSDSDESYSEKSNSNKSNSNKSNLNESNIKPLGFALKLKEMSNTNTNATKQDLNKFKSNELNSKSQHFNSNKPNTNLMKNNIDITIILSEIIKQKNDYLEILLDNNKFDKDQIIHMFKMACTYGNIYFFIKLVNDHPNLFLFKNDVVYELISISASKGYYRLTNLILSIFNKNNKIKLKFADSVQFGNLALLKLYESISKNSIDLTNSLEISIINDYENIIKYLFESPIKQKYQLSPENSEDLLKLSICNNKLNIFKYLINQLVGFDKVFKEYPNFYDTYLAFSCEFGKIEIVKFIYDIIVKKKAKIDLTESFIAACKNGHNSICQLLLEANGYLRFSEINSFESKLASLNKKTFSLFYNCINQEDREMLMLTFLKSAIANHNNELVEFLLEKNYSYENALIESVSQNDIEIVKTILKFNNNPSFINKLSKNGTALNIAVLAESRDIVKILLSVKGIDLSLKDSNNKTPMINSFVKYNHDIINLIFNFYGDNIQSQTWQLNESFKELIKHLYGKNGTYVYWRKEKVTVKPEDEKIINRFLELSNIDLNYNDECNSLLIFSCESNLINIVSKLIKKENVDLNLCDKYNGETPLMIAINNKNIEIAEILIHSQKTNINARSFYMETALSIATKKKMPKIIDLIINNPKFDPDESRLNYSFCISIDDKKRCRASSYTNEISLKLISLKNLDVNYIPNVNSYTKETALIKAVNNDDVELLDMILHHPSFDLVKSHLKKAIFAAIQKDNVKVFKKLLVFVNNDINLHLQNDESLLVISSYQNSIKMVSEILNDPHFDSIKSQISEAFEKMLSNKYGLVLINIEILEMLYKYDDYHCHLINFKKILQNGKTFFTIISGSISNAGEIATFLLTHGADPNLPDAFGVYPLQHAISTSSLDFVRVLINCEKTDIFRKITYTDESTNTNIIITSSFLHLAAKSKNSDIFKTILDLNLIDINSVDSQGETPLIVAARYEQFNNIKILFGKEDLDYNHKNISNKDAIMVLNYLKKNSTVMSKSMTKNEYLNELMSYQNKTRIYNTGGLKLSDSKSKINFF